MFINQGGLVRQYSTIQEPAKRDRMGVRDGAGMFRWLFIQHTRVTETTASIRKVDSCLRLHTYAQLEILVAQN